jgi:eukaryotic-like serine/threonine-protein kinase
MTNSYRIASGITAAVLSAVLLLPVLAHAQLPRDPAERAKVIAQILEANARQITLFDREGNVVTPVGPRDMYNQPVLSPDGKRVAVVKADIDKETSDIWVLDVSTARGVRVTSTSQSREGAGSPVWSPDGSQLAYVALRGGFSGLYRKASSGEGTEELLYQSTAPVTLTDWSMDGRFLSYFATDLSGGAIYALPVNATGERKPIEMFRSKSQVQGPRLSPDGRFVAYVTNETGRNEIYVRPFDPTLGAQAAPAAGPWQISTDGGQGMAFWRRDGKELYFLSANRSIMAVSVTTSPAFTFSKPSVLFRPSEATPVAPGVASISRDGERVVIAVPPPQLRQLTVFDRQGKVVSTAGQPGLYVQPGLSPDGTRVVVMRNDPQTGNQDIWTVDLASGKGTPITSDTPPENAPIWSPDGKHVAYVSTREGYSGIYRKAADGSGQEELLFRYTPGAGMILTDWSPDGKFLTFYTGVLVLVPLRPDQKALDRKEIDWLREDYDVVQGRFSPDGRFLAYLSNEADAERMQVYVRPFDASKPEAPGPGAAVQVSKGVGAIGMVFWREDGKEMYFLTRDWEVMAVDVTTTPTFQAGEPRLLFKLPGPLPGNPSQWKNVSRDGQRFIFAMPAARGPAR